MSSKSFPKRTADEQKIHREVSLLLYLNEISIDEILIRYDLENTTKWRRKLSVWKMRAGKKHLKLPKEEQRVQTDAARARLYGVQSSAIPVIMPQVQEITEEIDPLELFEDDNDTLAAISEIQETTATVDKGNQAAIIPSNSSPVSTPQQSEENDTDKSLNLLKEIGAYEISAAVVQLQKITAGELFQEKKTIDRMLVKVEVMIDVAPEAKDIKALVQAYESLISLKRKIAILPFGSVNPNVQPAKDNTSKHLHLHNYGLKGFTPGQGT